MYTDSAYLLQSNGFAFPVENHPSINNPDDYQDIADVIVKYGNTKESNIAKHFKSSGCNCDLVFDIYQRNWCKVRVWGTFQEDLTFRIALTDVHWYGAILQFLLNHPEFNKCNITVESDKRNKNKKVYWKDVSAKYILDPCNAPALCHAFAKHYKDTVLTSL